MFFESFDHGSHMKSFYWMHVLLACENYGPWLIWTLSCRTSNVTIFLGPPETAAHLSNIVLSTADSKKLEHGWRMIYAGVPFLCSMGLEDGHVPTFWLLLSSTVVFPHVPSNASGAW